MNKKADVMLKVLLNRFHQGSLDDIIAILPEDQANSIKSMDIVSQELEPATLQLQDLLKGIHYSWVKPLIEEQPLEVQILSLSALPEPHCSKLMQLLHPDTKKKSLAKPLQAYLLQRLHQTLQKENILPVSYLPVSPLSVLAKSNKKELLTLVDYLGIYDLAEAIRQIVDKRNLKKVYQCLSDKKQQFLHSCLHQKERLVASRINLDEWDGDSRKLNQLLHRRGMMRLGTALSDQHPDLIWHICHTLDTGRAAIITKCIAKKKPAGVVPASAQQIINLMNYLNKKTES